MKKCFLLFFIMISSANLFCSDTDVNKFSLPVRAAILEEIEREITKKVRKFFTNLPYHFLQLLTPVHHDLLEKPHREMVHALTKTRSS